MTYLLQIQTKDLGLQLMTEVTASSVSELSRSAKAMVRNNPQVIGLPYRIWGITKVNGVFSSNLLRSATVSGR